MRGLVQACPVHPRLFSVDGTLDTRVSAFGRPGHDDRGVRTDRNPLLRALESESDTLIMTAVTGRCRGRWRRRRRLSFRTMRRPMEFSSALLADHPAHEIGDVLCTEFPHDVRTVKFDSALLMPSARAASLLESPIMI